MTEPGNHKGCPYAYQIGTGSRVNGSFIDVDVQVMPMTDTDSRTTRPASLLRFRLGGVLGEGADLQVFSGEDIETGAAIVIKRPHPTLVSRSLHDDVERRLSVQTALRLGGQLLPGLPRLHVLTEPDPFVWFFGDDLGRSYPVLVEDRARGVPLMGSIGDQVRGHPVGLPLNLFMLHPSARHVERAPDSPALDVLKVIERCLESGYLARDLGPRNVLYAPASRTTTVIDLGDLREPQPATKRREQVDIHDVLLEFFASYTTPEPSPTAASKFAGIRETRLSGTLNRRADALCGEYVTIVNARQRDAAVCILDRIGRRGYATVSEFRSDIGEYLAATGRPEARGQAEEDAWAAALNELRGSYWQRFLFDADVELASYA